MPQHGSVRRSRPPDGALAPNRTCQTYAEGRGGTYSRCTTQTMAKKEGLVASIRPRPSSAQVMVKDMTTRVGKHPNLASRQAMTARSGAVRAAGSVSIVFVLQKLKTENGSPIMENRSQKIEKRRNAKQTTEHQKRKTEKKQTENRYRKVESGKRHTVTSWKTDYVSSSCLLSNIGHGIVLIASAVYDRPTTVV